MLQIGFSNKYFTLWNVIEETRYTGDKGQYRYDVTIFTYIQNLSLSKDKAIEKAKSMGCTDLKVNDDLKGISGKSFERAKVIEIKYEDFQFNFGKYTGDDIRENNDLSYLKWFYNESNNIYAGNRVVELDKNYIIYKGDLMKKEAYNRIKRAEEIDNKLHKTGSIDLDIERNADGNGFLYVDNVNYYFENSKCMYYNGYEYSLPVLNGKAKRIKGKTITVNVESGVINGWDVWIIKSWDFKK